MSGKVAASAKLSRYRAKRDFTKTPEPDRGRSTRRPTRQPRFCIQEHHARRLHFDLRLEARGVLLSWAVPKGLPTTPGETRLAIRTEDHPIHYLEFEGVIPPGQYGAGTMMVWDAGTWSTNAKTLAAEVDRGKFHMRLEGARISGEWHVIRTGDEDQWLIRCAEAKWLRNESPVRSVISERTIEEIRKGKPPRPAAAEVVDALPDTFAPMLASNEPPPPSGHWFYEIKFDGWRVLAFCAGSDTRLITRNGKDVTRDFGDVAAALSAPGLQGCLIDGELVSLDPDGRPNFGALAQARKDRHSAGSLFFYAFDLPYERGTNLCKLPIEERKARLEAILPGTEPIRYSASLGADLDVLREHVSALGLEGLVGKRAGSLYRAGTRSKDWRKIKWQQTCDVIIGGITPPEGARRHFGALITGWWQDGKLRLAGRVGSGFSDSQLETLAKKFAPLAIRECPFEDVPTKSAGRWGQGIPARLAARCTWLDPRLVCRVKFSEWTSDGMLRHPVFMELRRTPASRCKTVPGGGAQ